LFIIKHGKFQELKRLQRIAGKLNEENVIPSRLVEGPSAEDEPTEG